MLLTWGIADRWLKAGRPPFSNLYESLVFFGWAVVFIFIYFIARKKIELAKSMWIGAGISLVNLVIVAYASLQYDGIEPLMPALQSNWLTFHVVTCFLSYAAFAFSFVTSIICLVLHSRGQVDRSRLYDQLTYQGIAFGFPFLTIGILSGAIWANEAWGTYWGWDPKEVWSAITWLIYGGYLHFRLIKKLKDFWANVVSIAGFAMVIFTYIGVSYLLPGLHSYAS
jgi:cytochrome c-type biogenesis protein CcsB